MRKRLFLLGLLLAVAAFTTALAPLSFAVALRNRAGARGRRIMKRTQARLAAAGEKIVRRIRAAVVPS